ncbi:hypothetical protein EVAR_44551_1 [Eumeta japonica]|uniref:Uncharacterized protein n=1 Tax=Eumeta variegata TaxID=151549 RepID=A0A4C1XCJ9_EUMVA|nr:hypothetical protein EVAR_44551_1 [Eumeta japonica]
MTINDVECILVETNYGSKTTEREINRPRGSEIRSRVSKQVLQRTPNGDVGGAVDGSPPLRPSSKPPYDLRGGPHKLIVKRKRTPRARSSSHAPKSPLRFRNIPIQPPQDIAVLVNPVVSRKIHLDVRNASNKFAPRVTRAAAIKILPRMRSTRITRAGTAPSYVCARRLDSGEGLGVIIQERLVRSSIRRYRERMWHVPRYSRPRSVPSRCGGLKAKSSRFEIKRSWKGTSQRSDNHPNAEGCYYKYSIHTGVRKVTV